MRQCQPVCLVIALLLLVLPVFGQSTGVIQGTLVDPQGGVLVNAKIVAFDEAKEVVVREVETSGDGSFQLRALLPGRYTVRAELQGFKKLERQGLVLDPNQTMNLGEMRMELGATAESVQVSETAPQVETTTSNKSFVISSRQVSEISLNGRDFQSLLRTLPGVVSNDRSDFRLAFNNTDSFNVNGMRGSANNAYLDGSINTDVGANDGQYTQMSMDAVNEFKLQTGSFNAEYGRNPGVVIAATTKSGTSDYHGTAYEFLRNDAFDSTNFFDNANSKQKPALRFDQFGGNLGGPIYLPRVSTKADKRLFFFFNYEGTRASRPTGNPYVDVAHPDLLNGDFKRAYRYNADGSYVLIKNTNFPVGTVFQPGTIRRDSANNIIGGIPFAGNVVPKSMWAQNTPAFLKIINRIDRSIGAPVAGVPDQVRVPMADTYRFRKDQQVARVDWTLSAKTNFFFRWVNDAPQRESAGLGIFSGNSYPVYPQYRKKPGASWSWNLIRVISPTLTNEAIFTYNHLTQVVDVDESVDPATYKFDQLGFTFKQLYPDSNLNNKFPQFGGCGPGACGFTQFASGWLSEGKTFAWTDNITKIASGHALKAGVFFNINANGQQPAWTDAPNIQFGPSVDNAMDSGTGLANLLMGNYTTVQQTDGRYYGSFRFLQLEFFAQDSWKASRKLTLDYGVRWAYLGPTYTRGKYLMYYWDPQRFDRSKAVSIDITSTGARKGSIIPGSGDFANGMVQEGTPGWPLGGMDHRKNNWSPRFGVAYDPKGDGKTSIRAGFGTFFERIRQNVNNFDGLGNPPLSYTPTVYSGNVDAISPALIATGTRFPVGIRAIDRKGMIPTTYQWSVSVQRQLPGGFALDTSYIGWTARHLQYSMDYNQLPQGTTTAPGFVTPHTNAIRPYLGYQAINYTDYGSNANYHGWQTRLSRRFGQTLTANLGYTWSKVLDVNDGDSDGLRYRFNRMLNWGPAGYDRTHVFNADWVYVLPTRKGGNALVNKIVNGWEFTGIGRIWTGTPLTITSGGNAGAIGGQVYADYLGGQVYPDQQDRFNWFNPLLFARPLDGQWGNTAKGFLRGPGFRNLDTSLFKNTNFGERFRTQLRFEFFNVLNHTQWSGVNTGLSTTSVTSPGQVVTPATRGTTGQISNARDPRTMQLSFKLYF